jgi:hypothetical protein
VRILQDRAAACRAAGPPVMRVALRGGRAACAREAGPRCRAPLRPAAVAADSALPVCMCRSALPLWGWQGAVLVTTERGRVAAAAPSKGSTAGFQGKAR